MAAADESVQRLGNDLDLEEYFSRRDSLESRRVTYQTVGVFHVLDYMRSSTFFPEYGN